MAPRAASTASSLSDVDGVVADLCRGVADPVACFVACTVDVDLGGVVGRICERFPRAAVVGVTSSQQVASDHLLHKAGALFLAGDGFAAGAASGVVDEGEDADEVAALGERLATLALARAGVGAAAARFVVVHATPGTEEGVLRGIARVIKDDAVVIGGSGADDDVSGRWRVGGPDVVTGSGAAVLVCDWPWKIASTYQGGYLATEHQGRVTRAAGRRLYEIDGRPAADVYEGWMGKTLPRGQSVLGQTTMTPFAVAHGVAGGLDVHVLVHPGEVKDDGSIACFAPVSEGDRIVMMEATTSSLVRRGGLVNKFALQQAGLSPADLVAGYVIYCAGCSMALGDDVDAMTRGITAVLPGVPFLMPFTLGEQGRLRRGRVDHGNLMLSTLLLSSAPRRAL